MTASGTHNRIVPLGGGYLELLAVADAGEAAGSALGAALMRRIETVGEGLLGYAVSVDDVDGAAERLGTAVTTISRDGFTGRLAAVAEALREPYLPFFLHRSRQVPIPARAIRRRDRLARGVRRRRAPGGWRRAALPVRIVAGPPAVRAMGIGEGRVIHGDGRMQVA